MILPSLLPSWKMSILLKCAPSSPCLHIFCEFLCVLFLVYFPSYVARLCGAYDWSSFTTTKLVFRSRGNSVPSFTLLIYAQGIADRSVSLVGVKSFPCFLFKCVRCSSPCVPLCMCSCLCSSVCYVFLHVCEVQYVLLRHSCPTVNVPPLVVVFFLLIFQPNSQILSSFVSVRLLVYDSFVIGESSQSTFNQSNSTPSFSPPPCHSFTLHIYISLLFPCSSDSQIRNNMSLHAKGKIA